VNEPTVWEYEREDFMTTKPYEELYQFHVQPFVHATQMESLAAYAASKGFRGFKSMYKKYVESLKAQSGTLYIENVTQFTNQPLELNAGEWEADDLGIHKKNGFNDEIACPHPIMPVERLVNIDTGEEKLQLAYRKGAVWRHLIVSKTVLASSNKVTDLAGSGIAVNSQNARAFIQYISDMENLNYDLIPEKKSIGSFGYIPDAGFSPFVDGLIFDGDANFKAMFQTVRSRGSEAKWLETAAEVRSMSITARIILAASFASVLLEPLNCLPFFVHLWGVDSGTGKTVALMVAASVWGDPAVGAYVKTFDGTVVGMEKTAAFLNNLPFCLDELQLAKDNKGRTMFDVYKLAQGVGRTRGNRAGGVDLTPTWRNCILTTGESPLTGTASGAGAVNRVIDIECKSSQAVIKDGMRISNSVKRNFGFAGRKFVDRLYQLGVVDQVSERYRELFRILSDRDTTEKQAMAAASIILADELACQWIFSGELHPKSWTRKSTKGVQKSMGKELFSEELKLAVVQYVLEGHTCKEASEKFCVSCTPIEKWVNLYKLHGAKGLLSRNLVGRQKGFDGEFRLKVLQYKQEHHLSCTQTAMHFCLDVVTVCRWEKKFQKEGARGLMKKQATKGSEKRQKKQEQSELQQENKRLSEENYRLRMENDYLKKLNALIQKREKPE